MSNVVTESTSLSNEYDALVSRLKQLRREGTTPCAPAIAVVAYDSGAGVSSATRALACKMNAGPKALRAADVTVAVAADGVLCTTGSIPEFIERIFEQHRTALKFVFNPASDERSQAGFDQLTDQASFEHCLAAAQSLFRLVLVECPPLKKSAEIATVAPLVDGVLIVVEANRTTRSQIERLVNTIQTAGGNILGCVLNKQTFLIPTVLYQICEKAGLI
jgi:hypothetical protein